MQPFDALTARAVLHEAKPLLVNRKVDRIQQTGRDEVVISLRSRSGASHLLLSAHTAFGRLCLVQPPQPPRRSNPPAFCMLLRKHLTGATLVGVEQMTGERIVDVVFSCIGEAGTPSLKVLTAEIMGRHSNLIFWEKENDRVIGASHVVTREMSRQREVAPGLTYVRPPRQEKPNLFKVSREELFEVLAGAPADRLSRDALDGLIVERFAGLGRNLAEEIVAALVCHGRMAEPLAERLWEKVEQLQRLTEYRPAMRLDLTCYTVLSWWPDAGDASQWKSFPSVNDMVEEYFRSQEVRERFQQLRDRLKAEVKGEMEKLDARLATARRHLETSEESLSYKKLGDLILAHATDIQPGQTELVCRDLFAGGETEVVIPLNPALPAAQNAQRFYRQFSKARTRTAAAGAAERDASARMATIQEWMEKIEAARTMEELERLREVIFPRRTAEPARQRQAPKKRPGKPRLLSIQSSDGWTIYLGRNRHENDQLVTGLAQPNDIWMHVQGHGGAHVLIRVPSSGREPPETTLREAAQLAARMSKAAAGGKIRVVYTQCKHVRKVPGNKPGVVRYENERTLDVDTSSPMPHALKQLFAQRHRR